MDVNHMRDAVTVRFRVADVYKDRFIAVYYDCLLYTSRCV